MRRAGHRLRSGSLLWPLEPRPGSHLSIMQNNTLEVMFFLAADITSGSFACSIDTK
jgi:hypothetical protein